MLAIVANYHPNLGYHFFFSFKNLALPVTRYHGQLSSHAISKKLVTQSHSVHPPPSPLSPGREGEKGLNLILNFQKKGASQVFNFRRGLLGKKGGDLFQGVFY